MMKINNKGLTLVELIITLALLSIILAGAFSVYIFSIRVHQKAVDEFEIQAATRLTAQHVNDVTRYATATFTVPKSSFREDNLTDGWSYIGILNGDVARFEWKEDGPDSFKHIKTVIAKGSDLVQYEIEFHTTSDEDSKVLAYRINGYVVGRDIEYDAHGRKIGHVHIDSQLEVLNSMQIVHRGVPSDPAVAIAYRMEDRGIIEIETNQPVANIAFVIDRSGSMAWHMQAEDKEDAPVGQRRIDYLKDAAKGLMDSLAASSHPVNISLVPFSTTANNSHGFLNAYNNLESLKSNIDSIAPGGGTNTGDGLRRGYYQIVNNRNHEDMKDKDITEYMIVLVDGLTSFGSYYNNSPRINHPIKVDGNIHDSIEWNRIHNLHIGPNVIGIGSTLDQEYGTRYVNTIGDMIKGDGNIKVYVIGFSGDEFDLGSVSDIAIATNAEKNSKTGESYFIANDFDALTDIFAEIQKEILSDLWFIAGPKL